MLPVFRIFEKYTFSRASKINLVSEGFKDYVKKKYPNPNLSFHTNGIDNIFLPPFNSFSPQFENFDQKDGVIKILYAGNLGEGQVIDKILPDLSQLLGNQYQFIVIGDGSRKKNLLKTIDEKELKNLNILDPVSRDELITHYKNADILFLHLDDNQAFKKVLPSKIFEYAATGKPILAGVAGYPGAFIEEYITNAQVFPPCNSKLAEELVQKLEIVFQSRDEFIDMFARSNIMQKLAIDILDEVSSDAIGFNKHA
jgi:glycosyltransferase involved in cell wall biosynthesis